MAQLQKVNETVCIGGHVLHYVETKRLKSKRLKDVYKSKNGNTTFYQTPKPVTKQEQPRFYLLPVIMLFCSLLNR